MVPFYVCGDHTSGSVQTVHIHHHRHHHHIYFMELGHLLTRSGLTYSEVSSKIYHDSFCQFGISVSLPWVIYFETCLTLQMLRNDTRNLLNCVDTCTRVLVFAAVLLRVLCLLSCDAVLLGDRSLMF